MDDLGVVCAFAFGESSESSETDDEVTEIIKYVLETRKIPKITNYLDIVHQYSDQQFKSNFRVTRETAAMLTEKFKQSDYFPSSKHGGSTEISAENQMLSFLWFAGNKSCLRDVADRFGVSKSTCHRQCMRVINFFVSIAAEVIQFPRTIETKIKTAADFEKVAGFPDVIGCIDGCSIHIRTPANKIKSTYVNRHDIPSITLQGICDSRRRFLDVFTGPPGKVHDSRVFKLSFIYEEMNHICGQQYHLLGDSAYAIREYLLTPYRDYGNLTEAQALYNKHFCATRVLIENTFGLLKGRFRQLMCLEFQTVARITNFIVACCVLHNLCIDATDILEELHDNGTDNNEIHQAELVDQGEIQLRRLGEVKRNQISEQLFLRLEQ